MEPGKLEEYSDATGVALLNAYNNGLLSRIEYQLIQRFKREAWDDADAFLKTVVDEESQEATKPVESTIHEASKYVPSDSTEFVDSTKPVESTKKEASNYVESTKDVVSTLTTRRSLRTASYTETDAPFPILSNVNIKSNFTKFDNDVSDLLNKLQTPLEQSIYNRLYRLSVGWGKNYCRVSSRTLLAACNIKDKRTLNTGLDGLIQKGHIQTINRNNRGVLYRIFFPQEILNNDSSTNIEMTPPADHVKSETSQKEGTNSVDSTRNADSTYHVESTQNEDSTKSPPFKDIYKDNTKDSLSPRAIVSSFYKGIGQSKISKAKRERAEKSVKELTKDGFSLEDIYFAVEWTLKSAKEELYDFSIIKHTIGQAMTAKKKTEAEEVRRIEAERIAAQERAEEELREREAAKIGNYKESLGVEERAELREKAEAEIRDSGQFKEDFITDFLIEAKENEIVREQIGINVPE